MNLFQRGSEVRIVTVAPDDGRVARAVEAIPAGFDWPVGRRGRTDDDVAIAIAVAGNTPVGLAALRGAEGAKEFEVRRLGAWPADEEQRRRVALELLVAVAKVAAEKQAERLLIVVATDWGRALVEKAMAARLTAIRLDARHPGGQQVAEPEPPALAVALARGPELAEVAAAIPRGFTWPISAGARAGDDDAVAVARLDGRPIGLAALRIAGDEFHVRRLGVWDEPREGAIDVGLRLLDVLSVLVEERGGRELHLTPQTDWGREFINQAHFSLPMSVRTVAPEARGPRWRRRGA